MPPKLGPENLIEKTYLERREELKSGFGIVLCTKQKDGKIVPLQEQVGLAEEIRPGAVQFDFRNRTDEEIQSAIELLIKYHETHPEITISVHGETPKIDEATLNFSNIAQIKKELELLIELSGESFTIHPPSINAQLFSELQVETRETILHNYGLLFADSIIKAIKTCKPFTIAIENMPTKGAEGSHGQSAEDILTLIKHIENILIGEGVDPQILHGYLGATLDINHALHDKEESAYESILKDWFEKLGDYLKVIHLYTPSEVSDGFIQRYKIVLELASQFSHNARIFMESKQNTETTADAYKAIKGVE